MNKKLAIGIGIVLCLMAAACAPSRLALDYGTSHQLAKVQQTLNPQAGKNLEPPVGMDGPAALNALDKYRKGFEQTAPATNYIINVGGMGR